MPAITDETFRDAVAEIRDLKADVELYDNGDVKTINFVGTGMTDDGLATVALFENLQRLYLGATEVSDEGLRHLTRLRKLEYLSLHGSNVTSSGMNDIQKDLPNCKIRPRRDPMLLPAQMEQTTKNASTASVPDEIPEDSSVPIERTQFRQNLLNRIVQMEKELQELRRLVEQLGP